MSKKCLTFMLVICFCLLIFGHEVNAITYDDSNSAGYEVTNHTLNNLNGGVFHTNDWGNTIKSGTRYSQQTNVLTMKTDAFAKVVTWAIKDASKAGFVRQTVASIARDYERTHPGWTVMGGINGDQYYTKYGTQMGVDGSDYFYPQPYYPMIADYENWFAITATPFNNGHIVGFLNDGSVDPLVYQNAGWNYVGADKASIRGLFVTIVNQDGENQKFALDAINQAPGVNQSSLYSPVYDGASMPAVVVTGSYVYVVENSALAYMSNATTFTYKTPHNQNAFFGKGTISQETTSATLNKSQFAISTQNQDLIDALAVGISIVVQYEFDGPLANVESGIGFHQIMRMNGSDRTSSATYNTSLYPRAMFGRQADGTMVLVAVDGRQVDDGMVGVNMHESNAILKHYGVVEGYQMDGGGSVTMVVRDGDDFVTVNSPSDGNDRSVFNAVLFVVKDIEVDTSFESTLPNQLTFLVDVLDDTIGDIFIRMNNVLLPVIDGNVTFTGLTPNTMYRYEYVTFKEEVLTTSVVSGNIYTAKRTPYVEVIKFFKDGNDVIIEIEFYDPDLAITRRQIEAFGQTQTIARKQVIFADKSDISFDQVKIHLSYNVNDGLGRRDITIVDFPIRCDLKSFLSNIKYKIGEEVRKIYE